MSQNNTIDGQYRLQGVSATVVFISYKLKCKEKPVPIDGITPLHGGEPSLPIDGITPLHGGEPSLHISVLYTAKGLHSESTSQSALSPLHCSAMCFTQGLPTPMSLYVRTQYDTYWSYTVWSTHTLGVYVHLYSFLHMAEIHSIQV